MSAKVTMLKYCTIVLVLILAGCSSSGRYSMKHDRSPADPVNVSHVENAVPKIEAKSRGGNKSPYVVFGKRYYILPSAKGYVARGGASWYGRKFHGHLTSNGETYDMYTMSAAHKSLPLPTYVQVTNLKNGLKVIVRVNDRGPFHQGRIIDLSYAAASKLDMLKNGTAQVEVRAIDPRSWQQEKLLNKPQPQIKPVAPVAQSPVQISLDNKVLQIGAFSSEITAKQVQEKIQTLITKEVKIKVVTRGERQLYRVRIEQLDSQLEVRKIKSILAIAGYPNAHLVDIH